MSNIYELAGFAETPQDIDGDEIDFNAYNFCLAEEYINAFVAEDFEVIGDISYGLLKNIIYWCNYDDSLGNQELKEQFASGTLKTINNRSIIEAIYINKNISCAESYIDYGVFHPLLLLTIILSSQNISVLLDVHDDDTLNNIFINLFNYIEYIYQQEKDKKTYLEKIKNGISRIHYSKNLHQIPIPANLSWVKALKN